MDKQKNKIASFKRSRWNPRDTEPWFKHHILGLYDFDSSYKFLNQFYKATVH